MKGNKLLKNKRLAKLFSYKKEIEDLIYEIESYKDKLNDKLKKEKNMILEDKVKILKILYGIRNISKWHLRMEIIK